jgi:NADH dehydrogenase
VILRPSIIFGPEDGFFNKFAEMARFFPALPLIGGGKTRFQPVFVGDRGTGHPRGPVAPGRAHL